MARNWCLLLLLSLAARVAHCGTDLLAVQIVHRHGARAPELIAPNAAAEWAAAGIPAGQLTPIGANQHRAFGNFLKRLYIDQEGFMPTTYDSQVTYARSSDYDRTLNSAQAMLSEFYREALIPIHTTPSPDPLLVPSNNCPSYLVGFNAIKQEKSDWVEANYMEQYTKMMDITGLSAYASKYYVIEMVNTLLDNIRCQQQQGIAVDPYLLSEQDNVTRIVEDYWWSLYHLEEGDARGPIGNVWLETLAQNLVAVAGAGGKKLYEYSAHDTTLVSILAGLSLLPDPKQTTETELLMPPYAASLIFELRGTDDQLTVHGFYGKPIDHENDTWVYQRTPIKLPCPDLKFSCDMVDFIGFLSKYPSDGCCVITDAFYEAGCDSYETPYSSLPSSCQLWRSLCPANSCLDELQVLGAPDKSCVDTTAACPTPEPCDDTGATESWEYVAVIAIALTVLCSMVALRATLKLRRTTTGALDGDYNRLDQVGSTNP